MVRRKKQRNSQSAPPDLFDRLPDDLVVCILSKLSSSASSPSEFTTVLLTCKRLSRLGLHPTVLSRIGPKALAVRTSNWSECAHRFLKLCVNAGNVEACYILGMIRFYCLQRRGSGASLMAKAAINSHALALYSLAIIHFNGSGGGSKDAKDLRAGVSLCARAAHLGHIDALREIGHCLQDGYGVRQNIAQGRRVLIHANARELASVLSSVTLSSSPSPSCDQRCIMSGQYRNHHRTLHCPMTGKGCSLLSDFGCNVPEPAVHPANRFLIEWFGSDRSGLDPGLRLCSHGGCGRAETRPNEFRRCSVCGTVNYCSRGCQALDWKFRHKSECVPNEVENDGDGGDGDSDDEIAEGDE